MDLGLRMSIVSGIPDSLSCILDSTTKTFSGFRNPETFPYMGRLSSKRLSWNKLIVNKSSVLRRIYFYCFIIDLSVPLLPVKSSCLICFTWTKIGIKKILSPRWFTRFARGKSDAVAAAASDLPLAYSPTQWLFGLVGQLSTPEDPLRRGK